MVTETLKHNCNLRKPHLEKPSVLSSSGR